MVGLSIAYHRCSSLQRVEHCQPLLCLRLKDLGLVPICLSSLRNLRQVLVPKYNRDESNVLLTMMGGAGKTFQVSESPWNNGSQLMNETLPIVFSQVIQSPVAMRRLLLSGTVGGMNSTKEV